jgi:hypothetical protein
MDGGARRQAADLSREEIYALVWEYPLNRVGPELGLDGPRLAKLCNKRLIPYPPPGYWSKRAVGRAPTATPLPPDPRPVDKPSAAPRPSLSKLRKQVLGLKTPDAAKVATPPPAAPTIVEPVAPADDGLDLLDKLHPKIRTWIVEHTREQKERIQENKRRRSDPWSWSKSLLDDLTERDLYRFRASSTLCHAFEKAGAKVKTADIHGKLTFTSQGRDVECAVKEKMSRPMKRPEGDSAKWTAYPQHHNSGLTSSGWLRAQITTWLPGEQPQWIEAPKKPFAALIPAIVESVIACVPRLIEWELQREEERRRYQEEERRRWEQRRLQEIDDGRWARFRSAATNWREKQLLDTFIAELEARLLSEGDQLLGDRTTAEWLGWAKERAADLDPLTEGITGLFRDMLRP